MNNDSHLKTTARQHLLECQHGYPLITAMGTPVEIAWDRKKRGLRDGAETS